MSTPRILVTNDDGIHSVGLHKLAQAMIGLGEVIVVAPDQEYSGAGAAVGALHVIKPQAFEATIEGIDTAWSISGPPALCVWFARMGAFGPMPDLIVSGINPGANVGRSVYHSGTVGACLTGRNGGVPGLAVSQSVDNFDLSGQGDKDALAGQKWDTAATLARGCAEAMLASELPETGVLNLNVPNVPLDELKGWAWTEIAGSKPSLEGGGAQFEAKATLEAKEGEVGTYDINVAWGDGTTPQVEGTDVHTVDDGVAALSWISRLTALNLDTPQIDAALDGLISG